VLNRLRVERPARRPLRIPAGNAEDLRDRRTIEVGEMRLRNRLRPQDGAAAVEFALIVGVLVMLLFGMLQFGLAFFQLQNLRAATREGARVGAVGGTVSQIKQRVSDASYAAIPSNSAAIIVEQTNDGATWATAPASGKGCPSVASQTTQSAVRVRIDLNSGALPSGLKNIFTVDIPLMPPISLKGVTVSGEFRCEGV
jgi:Flp pilus assembly protein TadG